MIHENSRRHINHPAPEPHTLIRLCNTDYCNADYHNADYRNADYRNADYRNAAYHNADYCIADYCNADYHNADYRNTDYCNADYQNVGLTGIQSVRYWTEKDKRCQNRSGTGIKQCSLEFIFLLMYQTEMTNDGMPMQVLVLRMPTPTFEKQH
jgi:hypothetical protein